MILDTKYKTPGARSGFTLVEAMIMLLIFSLITMTFYYVISLGTRYIQESKNRLGAISLANEKMEIIRNLNYDKVGISGGIPSGNIPQDEDVTENNKNYHVHTFVEFVDDSLDGTYPTDLIPNDYKRVKVTVSWPGVVGNESLSLVSRFVPPGLEMLSGDGVLAINIIDGQNNGNGVPRAEVHIVNNSVSPAVNISTQTDNVGHLMLPGAKASSQYQITASSPGYETVTTTDPSQVNYTPTDVNASVVIGAVNPASITINKLANLKIKATDYLGNSLAVPFEFHLEGGRVLGTGLAYPFGPVYNLVKNENTGSNGEKSYTDISPGQYSLVVTSPTGYEFIAIDPVSSPFYLLPESSSELKVKLAAGNFTSVLITAKNGIDGLPISGATVSLSNSSGYNITQTTNADGKVFFPNSQEAFLPGIYDLKITANGFQDNTSQIEIKQDELLKSEIQMNISTP